MKYPDGSVISVGDRVIVEGFFEGTVVVSYDDGKAAPGYSVDTWSSSEKGILVAFDNGSLLKVDETNDDGCGPPLLQRLV